MLFLRGKKPNKVSCGLSPKLTSLLLQLRRRCLKRCANCNDLPSSSSWVFPGSSRAAQSFPRGSLIIIKLTLRRPQFSYTPGSMGPSFNGEMWSDRQRWATSATNHELLSVPNSLSSKTTDKQFKKYFHWGTVFNSLFKRISLNAYIYLS